MIPSTIQVFVWCMPMVTGSARFRTPLLFIAGHVFMSVTGGLTAIMFLAIPFNQQVTETVAPVMRRRRDRADRSRSAGTL